MIGIFKLAMVILGLKINILAEKSANDNDKIVIDDLDKNYGISID